MSLFCILKASHATAIIFWSVVLTIWVLIIPDSSVRVLCWLQQKHIVGKRWETGRETAAEFCLPVFLSHLKGFLTCRKFLRHGTDGLSFPPKEVRQRIFIALKNPSPRPGLNSWTVGSNGNHVNHYTTEATLFNLVSSEFIGPFLWAKVVEAWSWFIQFVDDISNAMMIPRLLSCH
jgi:hypothetical protein